MQFAVTINNSHKKLSLYSFRCNKFLRMDRLHILIKKTTKQNKKQNKKF